MEDFKLLPIGQAELIVKLLKSDGIGFAEGKSEGGTAKSLYRKGWIEPFGKVGRRIRWRVIKIFSSQETEYLHKLSDIDPYENYISVDKKGTS